MSQTLTLELPEHVYKAMQQAAEQAGQTPVEWATQTLVQYLPTHNEEIVSDRQDAKHKPQSYQHLTAEELEAARQRLLQYAGAVNSGDPHSADNERIDTDLAHEYASTHEEE